MFNAYWEYVTHTLFVYSMLIGSLMAVGAVFVKKKYVK
ncbi:EYxxD motif small membrane protein [Thalassorhabdus alkalitolerans]|uniref:EYxxD motif small membrane protein n=1 Tax=Thalassorhabdus alkalitolerans TaxID=2282697 RepID=A0ABW0YV37_9BACI